MYNYIEYVSTCKYILVYIYIYICIIDVNVESLPFLDHCPIFYARRETMIFPHIFDFFVGLPQGPNHSKM